jgi:hypothetical protein
MSQAYRVAQIVETSAPKKKRVVTIEPGMIAAKIHPAGRLQKSTTKWILSGDVGWKDPLLQMSVYRYRVIV